MNTQGYDKIIEECRSISLRKNNDYASKIDNIAITGLNGISVRLLDKVCRVNSLSSPGVERKVLDESIRDTLLDIVNYAVYGVMLLDGTWGDKSPPDNPDVTHP